MSSGMLSGHTHARTVDAVNAKPLAANKIGAGVVDQNQSSDDLAENSVRKSETDTLR